MGYEWDFGVVARYWPQFAEGLLMTLVITALAFSVALTVGLVVVILRIRPGGVTSRIAVFYIEVFRGLPLLVILVWGQFALPILTGWHIPVFWIGVFGIGLHMSAFVAEDYRAGIMSVPRGHIEGARALGMPAGLSFRRIILPQAIRVVIGPILNSFIVTLKGSALLLILAFPELMYVGDRLTRHTFRPLEILTVVALLYLAVILPISFTVRRLQRSFARERT